jgi:hypothetical protein
MSFLAAEPDITPITNLITTWIHIGQALVGSVGALAFIFALACMSRTLLFRLGSVGEQVGGCRRLSGHPSCDAWRSLEK